MRVENSRLEISQPILPAYQKIRADEKYNRNFFHFYLLYAVIEALSVLGCGCRHLLFHEAVYLRFPIGGWVGLTRIPEMVVSRRKPNIHLRSRVYISSPQPHDGSLVIMRPEHTVQ